MQGASCELWCGLCGVHLVGCIQCSITWLLLVYSYFTSHWVAVSHCAQAEDGCVPSEQQRRRTEAAQSQLKQSPQMTPSMRLSTQYTSYYCADMRKGKIKQTLNPHNHKGRSGSNITLTLPENFLNTRAASAHGCCTAIIHRIYTHAVEVPLLHGQQISDDRARHLRRAVQT